MVHSQAITREVLEGFVRPTFAAGAVLWRKSGEHHEIAVAHRPFYGLCRKASWIRVSRFQ